MKIPYGWLNEWVTLPWAPAQLGARLTMAGFELEGLTPAAPAFTEVVVAEILSAEPHPQADKLRVCKVSRGAGEPLTIVCGASNARAGLKSALAIVGAKLPGDLTIKAAKLRGVESSGMLCSGKELGLSENSEGILELPADAPVGRLLRDYLDLDDSVLDLNVTPNRGDAMSVLGIAREVAALAGSKVTAPTVAAFKAGSAERLAVRLADAAGCPRFAGCVVRGIDNRAPSPVWLRERLRRAGLRCISPVVDVTNYVMLETGQPMHAYDLAKLNGGLTVRLGTQDEPLTLLDGKDIKVDADMLVVADETGAVGLGGVMGGARTAVSADTRDIFFEAAYFTAAAILGKARRIGHVTDAAQRFERGVDPTQQGRAIERAVGYLAGFAGGTAGPLDIHESAEQLPRRAPVSVRSARLARLLGVELDGARVVAALEGLGMEVARTATGWTVTPPAHRFDITIEADLIEEVARIVGFDAIPETAAAAPQVFHALPEERPAEQALLESLAARGYQEAITLAFVDPAIQSQLFPEVPGLALANPIASDLSVMRVSLWPGLLKAALENQRRQQGRVRLFEHGNRFVVSGSGAREIDSLAGVALGARLPEQWGIGKSERVSVDFYDVKADIAALLATTGDAASFTFETGSMSALHPGRTARVLRRGEPVGWIGELHPTLTKSMDFTYAPVLFELDAQALGVRRIAYQEISRFPQVRRDLAVVVDESVTLSTLTERVTLVTSSLLRDLRVFDVYRGPSLEEGRKSVAFGLIFQDISRTLTDEDVERLMSSVVADLRENLNARIRE
jgi:phenylalanyl-tRNA synthetase beta chain